MKQSVKAKRNIGLIVLTILVVVAIILVIYFVREADFDGRVKKGGIGQTLTTSSASICVRNMKVVSSSGGQVAGDGKCFLLLSVYMKANKKISLSPDKFQIKGGNLISPKETGLDYLTENVELKKGEEKSFTLMFEVEKGRFESYFLVAYGAQIDLGNTARVE